MDKIAILSIIISFLIVSAIPSVSATVMGDFNLPLDWILKHDGTSVDMNINGIIDEAENAALLGGHPPSYYLDVMNNTDLIIALSMKVDYTYLEANYYNTTEVNQLLANIPAYNDTGLQQDIQTLNNTKAGIGSCPSGYVVSATTISGVTCIPQSNATGNMTGNITLSKFVGATSGTYNGNITDGIKVGYDAANNICNTQYLGTHLCTSDEIIYTISQNAFTGLTGTGWIINGPPGYTANANDCKGWTSSTATFLGPFWNWDDTIGGGAGYLTACNGLKKLYCCG